MGSAQPERWNKRAQAEKCGSTGLSSKRRSLADARATDGIGGGKGNPAMQDGGLRAADSRNEQRCGTTEPMAARKGGQLCNVQPMAA